MPPLLIQLRRPLARLRRSLRREHALGAMWIGTLVALEVFGARSSSDVADVAGVAAILLLVVVTHHAHWVRPIKVVGALVERVRRFSPLFEHYQYRVGQDMRLEPAFPRRLPTVLVVVAGVALAAATALWLGRSAFPSDARSVLLAVSPVLYFVCLSALWLLLVAGSLMCLAPPIALRTWLDEHDLLPTLRRTFVFSGLVALVYLFALWTLSSRGLPWVPLVVSGVAYLVGGFGLLLPGGPRLTLIWRPVRGETTVATFEQSTLFVFGAGILWCVMCALVLAACGDRIDGGGDAATGVTAWLGGFFAWATAVVYTWFVLAELGSAIGARRHDPARVIPPVLRVLELPDGDAGALRGAIRAELDRPGAGTRFDLRFGGRKRTSTDVPIRVTAAVAADDAFAFFDRWPLPVAVAELGEERTRWRLGRRAEILRRRQLMRGLRRAFRSVPPAERARGLGVWVDPHLWFSPSLVQERDGEEPRASVGPPYRDVIPLPARSHLHHVLRALEVDLVFVERGVSFRQLRRVYATLFETYDVHGGKQRAEEHHFRGLAGLRVVIDLVTPDEPHRSSRTSGYVEPDYDDIGRARILHVFRDRNDARELVSNPRETDDVPQPMLV